MALTVDEIDRYGRQVLLPEWGAAGQERLRESCLTVAGEGAGAAAAVRYLAAAGVGRLIVACGAAEARAINPLIAVEEVASASDPEAIVIRLPDGSRIAAAGDRVALGAACALEAIKALLGLPHHPTIPD